MIGIDSKGVLSGILRMTSTACLQGYVFVVVKWCKLKEKLESRKMR